MALTGEISETVRRATQLALAAPGKCVTSNGTRRIALGQLSRHLQDDIGVVQVSIDEIPRVATEIWWR